MNLSVDTSLKWFFVIAPCLYLVNIVVFGLFAIKYKASLYRKKLFVWISYFIYVLAHAVLNEVYIVSEPTKSLWWTFFVFIVMSSIRFFASEIYKVKDNLQKNAVIYVFFIFGSLSLHSLGFTINCWLIPAIVGCVYPAIELAFMMIKKYKDLSFHRKGYLISYTLICIHILNYPYAVNKPELIFPGYLVGLILTTALSGFSLAVLVEQALLENEVKDLLHNTARLTALGGMAAEVAHEINNPLSIIKMNNLLSIHKLQNEPADAAFVIAKLETSERMVERLIKIMETLKTSYRNPNQDQFSLVTIGQLLEDVKLLCGIRLSKNQVQFNIDSAFNDITIECRHAQITQILQNLVNNSVDAIKNSTDKWIKINVGLIGSQYIEFRVVDSGDGIPDAIQEKIFENLFTTKSNGEGTGLGLSMSLRFAEKHGGSLKLDHQQNNTTFVLKLPLLQNKH